MSQGDGDLDGDGGLNDTLASLESDLVLPDCLMCEDFFYPDSISPEPVVLPTPVNGVDGGDLLLFVP